MTLPSPSGLFTGAVVPAALVFLLACPREAFAQSETPAASQPAAMAQSADQDHIVSSQDLQEKIESSSADRQKDIDTLTQFLSTPEADRAMRDAHVDAKQVRLAIPTLSDPELANLSARARQAHKDFSAGLLGIGSLTLIIILIIVIIILVAVH